MGNYWFKVKKYGIGTYPITWQGWLALLCLCILIITSLYINILFQYPVSLKDWLQFTLDTIILGTLFTLLFKEKTEGEIRWRWGK
jgi:uncharacterized membrane protein YhfC